MSNQLRRSMLFTPADDASVMQKSVDSDADVVVYDLEDTVSEANKHEARENVRRVVPEVHDSGPQISVRINDLESDHWVRDIRSVTEAGVDQIKVPMVESAWELRTVVEVARTLTDECPEVGFALETPRGIFDGRNIAETARELVPVTGIAFGIADYAQAVGARTPTEGTKEFLSQLVLGYASFGRLTPTGTVYLDYQDLDGLREHTERAREMGFTGVPAIHPAQVDVINDVFTPDEEVYKGAKNIVETFDATDKDSISVDGTFVDVAIVDRYRKIVDRYEVTHGEDR